MSDADFYNRNLYRRYPMVDERYTFSLETWWLPNAFNTDLVVDFGLVFFDNSGFDPDNEEHKVFFSGNNIYITGFPQTGIISLLFYSL